MTNHLWDKKYPANVDWDAELPARPLYALMDDAVARHGGKSTFAGYFLSQRWLVMA